MPAANQDNSEGRLCLALNAYKSGQIISLRKASTAYSVPFETLRSRYHGTVSQRDFRPASCKLTTTEEAVLIRRILDLDAQGFPPRQSIIRETANILLTSRGTVPSPTVGQKWATNFVKRTPQLRTTYTRKYDYQRKQCEDQDLIQGWFNLVRNTIAKYGITDDDIYNFDETGFQMGVIGTAKVVTGTEKRQGRVKIVQPGSREWVTVIHGVNAQGWSIPALVILKAKLHQASWYQQGLPGNWRIAVSENGWTDNQIGFEWIQHFHVNTESRTKGQYRLLILDGHGSHHTAQFEDFCKQHAIVTLCMPAHSSHILQPLDVACFGPLKRAYSTQVEGQARLGINHITKDDFLPLYHVAHVQAITTKNVKAGFAAAGLIPFLPDYVLASLPAQRTPTPPAIPSPPTLISKTPHTTAEMQRQLAIIRRRTRRTTASSSDSAFERLVKGCKMAIQNAAILQAENIELRAANSRRKPKKRKAIANGGTFTISEGLDKLNKPQSRLQAQVIVHEAQAAGEALVPKKRAAPKCSLCSSLKHNARTCLKRKR